MVTIFNRKQLMATFSMDTQSKIRRILADEKIDYSVKTINRKSSAFVSAGSRVRTGTFGENQNLSYEYVIYVKKQDFERSRVAISAFMNV